MKSYVQYGFNSEFEKIAKIPAVSNALALFEPAFKVFQETVRGTGKKEMMGLRKKSGESKLLKKRGVRYGEEYIPERGRRWNKLTKKLGTSDHDPAYSRSLAARNAAVENIKRKFKVKRVKS